MPTTSMPRQWRVILQASYDWGDDNESQVRQDCEDFAKRVRDALPAEALTGVILCEFKGGAFRPVGVEPRLGSEDA